MKTHRQRFAPLIAQILAQAAGEPQASVRQRLRAAFPYTPGSSYLYKVWLDEIRRQQGSKPPLRSRRPKPADPAQMQLTPCR